MKKVALSLAGLLAAAAFAPEASALPVFARQTGMACNACHFQHFPILNGFGRAFKASGYTLMGAQGKVEGDDLSLPDRLNMAVLTTAGIEKQTGNATITGNHDLIQVPGNGGELSLFFGGRVSENVGFLSEFAMTGVGANMASAKLPMLYDVGGGVRAGLVFLTTDGQGPSHSFEILNTGATGVHMATPMPGIAAQGHFAAASAAQYLGTGTGAAGASVVAVNPDMFFVNVGKYAIDSAAVLAALPGGVNTAGGAPSNALNSVYFRAAYIFDAAGFNMAAGIESIGGSDALGGAGDVTRAQIIDFQMMGDLSDTMNLLLTASYGKAPKQDATGRVNAYNPLGTVAAGGKDRTALTINASLGFTPKMTAIAGIRQAKNGGVDAAGSGLTDNAIQLGVTYSLAQNIELSLSHTRQSGTAWSDANLPLNGAGVADHTGQNMTSIKMEALF